MINSKTPYRTPDELAKARAYIDELESKVQILTIEKDKQVKKLNEPPKRPRFVRGENTNIALMLILMGVGALLLFGSVVLAIRLPWSLLFTVPGLIALVLAITSYIDAQDSW